MRCGDPLRCPGCSEIASLKRPRGATVELDQPMKAWFCCLEKEPPWLTIRTIARRATARQRLLPLGVAEKTAGLTHIAAIGRRVFAQYPVR